MKGRELWCSETMAVILSRVARNFAAAGGAARSSLSLAASSPSPLRRFSSPSLRPAVAVARSDVAANVDEEGDEGLGLAAASVVKAAEPTLLQPRVVVYDGVCHLCHRGPNVHNLMEILFFFFGLQFKMRAFSFSPLSQDPAYYSFTGAPRH